MNNYRINYIDGHDMRYKSFETAAKNKEDALSNLWATYKNYGDFDHQIIEIIKTKDAEPGGVRIGDAVLTPPPFTRGV